MLFREILTSHNIPIAPETHSHSRPGWIQFDCPFCGKGRGKFHAGFNIKYNYVNCWKCGSHGVIETLQELLNLSYSKCRNLIKDLEPEKYTPEKEHINKTLILPKNLTVLQKIHRNYLISRGYDPDTIVNLWKIQAIGIAAKYSWSIFIPFFYHGRMVSWTTRTLNTNENAPRYISASSKQEIINHKHILYGGDFARDRVIVCEGPLDVWKIGPGAVATCGINFSKQQIKEILNFPIRYICYDNETTAQNQAKKLLDILSIFPGKTYNICLDSKDPGEASDKEIKKLRKLLQ